MRKEVIGEATLYLGDCREVLPSIDRANIVITDPPYGVTDHEWDVPVHAGDYMVACGCVAFASGAFVHQIVSESLLSFKYELVWVKNTASNAFNAKLQPMRTHEQILIFGRTAYNPQKRRRSQEEMGRLNKEQRERMEWASPETVLYFDAVNNRSSDRTEHPSQKPVELLEWLIRTYTNQRAVVLDPFMGSGTTGVACMISGREFIGVERNSTFFNIACRRIEDAQRQQRLIA